jgi:hypothetical protein
MFKISEALIQFDERPLGKTDKVGLDESADRILKQYRSSVDNERRRLDDVHTPPDKS